MKTITLLIMLTLAPVTLAQTKLPPTPGVKVVQPVKAHKSIWRKIGHGLAVAAGAPGLLLRLVLNKRGEIDF